MVIMNIFNQRRVPVKKTLVEAGIVYLNKKNYWQPKRIKKIKLDGKP